MDKILVICGPTATGKTALALFLAKKFHGDLLSADSRQVYKRMDIITGKDLPLNAKRKTPACAEASAGRQNEELCWWETKGGVRIWLLDLVEPTESFSVSQWVNAAQKVIYNLWREKKLPIVVGATGFYTKALLGGIETLNIPPNPKLRRQLNRKDANELFEILSRLDALRAAGMNKSDRKNPRRLIRAIEIALWQSEYNAPSPKKFKADILMIGLTAPRDVLHKRIDKRVEERAKQGAVDEVEQLLNSGVSWENESMTGTGYRQLKPYFEGKMGLDEAKRNWKIAEHRDAKKQMTWFKKGRKIKWFDIAGLAWQEKVEKAVENWYSKK